MRPAETLLNFFDDLIAKMNHLLVGHVEKGCIQIKTTNNKRPFYLLKMLHYDKMNVVEEEG